jgi:D-3-phosphoglycerate dehydrogenase / 2-oxoglutarate reductase
LFTHKKRNEMKKILVSDAVDKKCVPILEKAGCEVTYQPGLAADELKKIIKDYNGLIVRSETKVTPEVISLMENMEVIGRAGAGVDNINLDAATRKGIIVMNTPGGNTISTAEHTMALLLSLCRNIAQANISMREGKWDRKKYKGTELLDKTIGIVGLGKIGREVASRSKAFGMKVIGYDPVLSKEMGAKLNINLVDIETIFAESDFITFHVPLNNETKNIINEESLKKCKDGVKIVNCARGGIIDETALVNAIDSGKVSGAAFDVYLKEPPDFSHPMFNHPKILATPHLGASTDEAQEKVALQIAEQIADLFSGEPIRGAVNAAAVEASENEEIAPFIKLAENLGSLQAQLTKGQLKGININYSGSLLHSATTLLSTSILKGFLSKKKSEAINLINAPYFAHEMGVEINETKTSVKQNYTNLLTVEFITDQESRCFAGTSFGNEIRIVDIDDFHLELNPEGNLLFYSNIDKPGMLATVGKILAEANVNIAGLSLGRNEKGKEALTVINLDQPVNGNIVSKLSSIEGVRNIHTVIL